MAKLSFFPVGDHFPRPYDANFLRLGNGRKINFSRGGPLSGVLTMLIFKAGKWPKNKFFRWGTTFRDPTMLNLGE